MYCSKCGKELPDDAKFCLQCGTSLRASTDVAPITPTYYSGRLHHKELITVTPSRIIFGEGNAERYLPLRRITRVELEKKSWWKTPHVTLYVSGEDWRILYCTDDQQVEDLGGAIQSAIRGMY